VTPRSTPSTLPSSRRLRLWRTSKSCSFRRSRSYNIEINHFTSKLYLVFVLLFR
jgi:hypothetical protein